MGLGLSEPTTGGSHCDGASLFHAMTMSYAEAGRHQERRLLWHRSAYERRG